MPKLRLPKTADPVLAFVRHTDKTIHPVIAVYAARYALAVCEYDYPLDLIEDNCVEDSTEPFVTYIKEDWYTRCSCDALWCRIEGEVIDWQKLPKRKTR